MAAISEYFSMGGYGAFIWPSYGITALVLIVLLMASGRAKRSNEAALAALQAEIKGHEDEKKA